METPEVHAIQNQNMISTTLISKAEYLHVSLCSFCKLLPITCFHGTLTSPKRLSMHDKGKTCTFIIPHTPVKAAQSVNQV